MSEVLKLDDCVFEKFLSQDIFSLVLWIKINGVFIGRNVYYWTLVGILKQTQFNTRSRRIWLYFPCQYDDYWKSNLQHYNGKCFLCKKYFHMQSYERQKLMDFINLNESTYQMWSSVHPSFVNRYYYMADGERIPRTFKLIYKHLYRDSLLSKSGSFKQLTSEKMEDIEEMDTTPSEEENNSLLAEEHIDKRFGPFKVEVEKTFQEISSYVGMRWTKMEPNDYGCILTVLDNRRIEEARKEILRVYNSQDTNIKGIGFCKNNIYLFPTA